MINLVAVPVMLPMVTAALLVGLAGHRRLVQVISLGSAAMLLAVSLYLVSITSGGTILVLPLGDWGAQVGIVWAVDALGAIMMALCSLVSLATLVYVPGSLTPREQRFYPPLHHFLVTGVNGAFATGDFFNLFVFFEILLLASFAMIALGGRGRQLNRTFPYVLVNLVGSVIFLAGVGALYGTAGTVNMAEVGQRVAEGGLPPAFWVSMSLLLLVFALKAALVPIFFWLPDAYPESSIPVSGFFAGLLTKVGVYALFRVVPLVSPEGGALQEVLLVVAAGTMFFGVVGALGRSEIRSVLSFHVISQVGYMVFGLALYTPVAVSAGIFYIVHHIIVKTALFFAGGLAEVVGGSGRLGTVRGLAATHPWAAVGFFIPAMALAGLPPFSGFWGKFFLVVGGFQAEAWISTGVAILVSLLTLASMLKIWVAAFWGPVQGQVAPERGRHPGMLGATLVLAGLSVLIGVVAPPLLTISERAADQLLAVTPYIEAVTEARELRGAP